MLVIAKNRKKIEPIYTIPFLNLFFLKLKLENLIQANHGLISKTLNRRKIKIMGTF